jgi:small subunit ribosomal protein S1
MVHVSEISAEKRVEHPQDVLKVGQIVGAQVLDVDVAKRQIKLSMKQLVPTSLDEYIAEHKSGDVVTGRIMEESAGRARVELGEGVHGNCRITSAPAATAPAATAPEPGSSEGVRSEDKANVSSLSAMLSARWKGAEPAQAATPEPLRTGQIRSFRIVSLDPAAKKIELEQA